jgi:NSS family neurotransmitter:Na+ symporter
MHGQWSSRFSFVAAAAGAAVGLGNIWKFPYVMGENGGGAFVIVYLACILLLGLPILMAEMIIGRRGRMSPGLSARFLAIESDVSPVWQIAGWIGLVAGFLILSFYSVIAGWAFAYVPLSANGAFDGRDASYVAQLFADLTTDPTRLFFWSSLVIVSTCVVVMLGVKRGLEQAARILMPSLFILLIALAIYAGATGEFKAAVQFVFYPDFSKLTINSVLIALGHAFFTLSLASGVMMTYGAYMSQKESIVKTAIWIAIADTFVAMIAAMVIYPIVFAHDLVAGQGPGLIFVTLPVAFGNMTGGILIGTLFFVMLVFAAFTSTIAMIEAVVAWQMEARRITRGRACAEAGLVLWLLSSLTVASFAGYDWAKLNLNILGKEINNWFELLDHLTSNMMLPIGGLVVAIFVGWMLKSEVSEQELNSNPLTYTIWRFCIRWITPVAVCAVFLNLLGLL